MPAFNSIYSYFKYCYNHVSDDSDEYLAGTCLKNGLSFQLPAESKSDKWIGMRELIRATRRWSSPKGMEKLSDGNVVLILGHSKVSKLVCDYIFHSSNEVVNHVIAKDELKGGQGIGWKNKAVFFVRSFLLALECVFSKNRVNKALLIRSVATAMIIEDYLRNKKALRIYNFVPFEIDSNMLALIWKSAGHQVIHIPSSGPLSTWNRVQLCNEIIFSTPYHYEEYNKHRATMRFDKIHFWGPENAHTYFSKYEKNVLSGKKKTLGFYSHGSWLRLQLGHTQTEMNLNDAEDACIKCLISFLKKNRDYKLIVFAHPREKKKELWERTKSHYAEVLKETEWTFGDISVPSAMLFDECSIGISTFSTIIYERLYAGFKTIICSAHIEGFPMKGSTLAALKFDKEEELAQLILSNDSISEEEFFKKYQVEGYAWKNREQFEEAHTIR